MANLSADLTLINTNVRTMNLQQSIAEAIAIKRNKIIKVGTTHEINQLIGKNTIVISLSGMTVVPGLIDTHIHVADFGKCLLWLDLTSAQSIDDVQSLLKNKVKKTPVGKWIIGRGWNDSRFKEKRLLNLADLDKVAYENPVILYHEAAMLCAVNSKALALAHVTRQTPNPSGGTIDRNSQTDELSGILRDSATGLVWQFVPEPTAQELAEATAVASQIIAEAGITSVGWIVLSENELPIIQKLGAEGKLPIRVSVIVPYELLKEIGDFKSSDKSKLHISGVFLRADGYLDSKTAALSLPYSDDPKNRGNLLLTKEILKASVDATLAVGLQPVLHAMGDEAVDEVLGVIERSTDKDIRFRIEQAAVLNKQLIKRLKNLNVVVSVQPKVIATEFTVWSATERLGIDRAKWLHPLRTLLKEGVKVAGGSDCPMEPLSPLLGIQEAVMRESFNEQRLSVEQALRMYTLDAAYCSCEERIKGSIEEGKLADLTVLSDDPLVVRSSKIKDITVLLTIIDGKVVYSKR